MRDFVQKTKSDIKCKVDREYSSHITSNVSIMDSWTLKSIRSKIAVILSYDLENGVQGKIQGHNNIVIPSRKFVWKFSAISLYPYAIMLNIHAYSTLRLIFTL